MPWLQPDSLLSKAGDCRRWGERRVEQGSLCYEFSLERHVPQNHLFRAIDRFVDLQEVRAHLASSYCPIGRPSVDPELLIRMLLVGYCFGIRPERRLCHEVHLNLAYPWFCRLRLDGSSSRRRFGGAFARARWAARTSRWTPA